MGVIVIEPVQLPEIEISELTKEELSEYSLDEGQVIVHCKIQGGDFGMNARIWHSTFLIDRGSSHKSQLVHAEGITFFPNWTIIEPQTTHRFLLIFSPLPKGCTLFDLVEEIPQSGGFSVPAIPRNGTDVYSVVLD